MVKKHKKCSGKGQQFERDVCRKLSLWVSHGESKNLFWRSSQSGGRATTLRRKGENLSVHAGDIAAIDPAGERFIKTFFVECKFLKTLRLDSLVYPQKGTLGPMWQKCQRQAAAYGKMPVMVVKENGKSVLLITNGGVGEMGHLVLAHFPKYGKHGMFVHLFEKVMRHIDPGEFIQGGENAGHIHGRSAPDRPKRGRVSLQDI